MYYYILDLGNKETVKIKEKMEMMMASYGISGDFGKISPLASAYELAKRAEKQGYTTIVAIGGSEIINQVAQALVSSESVFGIIPIRAPKAICELIGADSFGPALEILRTRKIETIDMGKIAENKYFLTEAEIKNPHPVATLLDFGSYKVKGSFKNIIIANGNQNKETYRDGLLEIKIDQRENKKGFFNFFKKPPPPFSVFYEDSFKIETDEQTSILVNDEVVAKTPCEITLIPFALKLIVAKTI